jgi:hypothetical protein
MQKKMFDCSTNFFTQRLSQTAQFRKLFNCSANFFTQRLSQTAPFCNPPTVVFPSLAKQPHNVHFQTAHAKPYNER